MRLRFLGFCACVIIGLLSVSRVDATIHTINLTNFSISPQNTAVLLGDTVRWVVVVGIHNSTSDGTSPKAWNSGTLNGGGASFSLVILPSDPVGDYPYTCTFHPLQMIDTLRVSAPVSCCVGTRGNVNNAGGVTVADLTYLVAFLFNSGPAPVCTDEANVNGAGGITVADLTFLVAFLFNSGPTPGACP